MTALTHIAPRLAKLIPMLSSDRDGEALGAVRAIGRTLESVGADFHDLARAVAGPVAASTRHDARDAAIGEALAIVDACLARSAALTPRERAFLNSIRTWLRLGRALTEKQASWLEAIHERVRSE